jgi:hypothetical protein
MDKACDYRIKVRGPVDESDLNTMSPLPITMVQADTDEKHRCAATLFTIYADQSGLIGLMRHLHGRGLVLLSVIRELPTDVFK